MSYNNPDISRESGPDLESETLFDDRATDTESKISDQPGNADKSTFDKVALRRKKATPVERTKLDVDACRDMASKTLSDQESRLREQLESKEPQPFVPLQSIENYRMATDCASSWENMTGSGCVKFCEICKLQVYDFSGMSMPEVQELVLKREDKKKFVLFKRKDGKFLTADCPVGLQRLRTLILSGVAGILLVLGLFYLQATLPPPPAVNPAAADKSATPSEVQADNTQRDRGSTLDRHKLPTPELPDNRSTMDASETYIEGMPMNFPVGAPQQLPAATSTDQTPTSPAPATTSTGPTAAPPTPAASSTVTEAPPEQSSQASTSDTSSVETPQPTQQPGVWQHPVGQ